MSRNEDFDNAFWDDPEIEDLSANASLLYIWSWTNPRCGMAGMYKVSHRSMTQSKVPLEDIPAALEELAEGGFAFYENQVLWVRSRVKRLRSKSPQMAKAVAKDLERVGDDNPLRGRFIAMYGSQDWLKDTLPIGTREPIDNPSENPIGKGKGDNLSGTPRGVPLTGTWTGPLSGSSSSEDEQGEETSTRDLARQLFADWQERCGHPNALPTQERLKKIQARLVEGYTPEQIRSAIGGAARAAFVNDQGKRFDDIELICRSGSKLEGFIERATTTGTASGRQSKRDQVIADRGDYLNYYDDEGKAA